MTRTSLIAGVGLTAWGLLVAGGFLWLGRYQATPGQAATPPATWPLDSELTHAAGTPSLLVFAHPQCSCTRATLHELARVMRYAPATLSAQVVFAHPDGQADSWAHDDLWDLAASIPGVVPHLDAGTTETRRFQSYTSGQVLFYDAAGRLRFSGGITVSRGHEGANEGRTALLDLVRQGQTHRGDTAVFGCPLNEADRAAATDLNVLTS